ncbi:hypothetical protein SY88_12655 [Clostridiales bacterium PH28_bin88]|nr:hypothetical protein SY88_12655 [Clostridiales bacterium PH28_bin88]
MVVRYNILRTLRLYQPTGRRVLAAKLRLPERLVRGEVEFLNRQELIDKGLGGMFLTPGGETLLGQMHDFVREVRGLSDMEAQLQSVLGLQQVVVVPGNSDLDPGTKKEMGRAVGGYLRGNLAPGTVIAVAGGTTMAEVAEAVPERPVAEDVLVVPARGGLGEEVEIQANTIAAQLAKKLSVHYRLLHAPDNLSSETMASLLGEPQIKEVTGLIKKATILIHGIGAAEKMARRRGLDPGEWRRIKEQGAVGEAFGYYFDARGKIVHATPSIGLSLEDMKSTSHVLAVAGGESKAQAIIAVLSSGYQHVLVTDEAAGSRIMELLVGEEVPP